MKLTPAEGSAINSFQQAPYSKTLTGLFVRLADEALTDLKRAHTPEMVFRAQGRVHALESIIEAVSTR